MSGCCVVRCCCFFGFFFFNDTATTEIYTLSLHDALPIYSRDARLDPRASRQGHYLSGDRDRKSTRLNSSHQKISYAVFCLKKKKIILVRFDFSDGATIQREKALHLTQT